MNEQGTELSKIDAMGRLYGEMTPDEKAQFAVRMYGQINSVSEAQGQLALGQESLRRDVEINKTQQSAEIRALADEVRAAADASSRRNRYGERYFAVSTLGQKFNPIVSGQRMNKLLAVIGVLTTIEPRRVRSQYLTGQEPLARPIPGSEFGTVQYNCNKVKALLDRWLEENELMMEFHTNVTKEERDAFIDRIVEEFPPKLTTQWDGDS